MGFAPHLITPCSPTSLVRLACHVAVWAWPLVANAAEPDTELPLVTVTGKRIDTVQEKYPDLQPDHPLNPYRVAPSSRLSVQTFSADDIEAIKPLDVFDLLNHAVGVLSLYQGRKIPYSVRIRGDLYFAYIIDGVYIPSEAGGRILQNLPVSAIEQIDVVRDATALTLSPMVDFGRPSGAPNDGYIVIRTRRPLGPEASVAARVESFDTTATHAYAGTADEHGYVAGLASHFDTAGKSGEFMAKHSESTLVRGGAMGAGFRAEVSLYTDHTRQQIQAADPGQSTLGLQRWQLNPIDTTFMALNASEQWSATQTTTLTLSSYQLDATMIAGTALAGVQPNVFPNVESINTADIKHTYRSGSTLLRLGGQHMRWTTPTGASYYEGYPRDEKIKGYFVTGEQGLFADNLTVDLAARQDRQLILRGVDHYYAYQMLFQQPTIFNRQLPADRFATLGAAFSPNTQWKLNARAYTARQGAVESVPAVSNKTLHPESQRKFEVGLAYVGWPVLRPAVTLFYTHIDNTKYPAQEVRSQNGLSTSLWDERNVVRTGMEWVAKGAVKWLGGHTDYTAGWTYLSGDTTNEDYGRTSPRNTFSLTLRHRSGPWDAAFSLTRVSLFESNWKAVDQQFHPIGDYSRVDVNVGRAFHIGPTALHASAYGRNVLNQRYETQIGYRDVGSIWGTELKMDW